MHANAGRTTGSTWRPAGGGASRAGQSAPGDVPATGIVLDLQGRGVAGARLWVLAIKRPPDDNLGPFLAALTSPKQRDDLWNAWRALPDAPPGDQEPAGERAKALDEPNDPAAGDQRRRWSADHRGDRARACHACPDRRSAIESKLAIFMTRPGPAIQAKELEGLGGLTVHGTPFEHIAAPSRPIDGVVRDQQDRTSR